MTDELENLAEEEECLFARVIQVEGTFEAREQQLREEGVFEAYRRIHAEYARLAVEQENLEALKRALFLQWYAAIEPSAFTGIPETGPLGTDEGLRGEAESQVLGEVDRRVREGQLDNELHWMLPLYYSIQEWYFDTREGLGALNAYLPTQPQDEWTRQDPSGLEGRGQMSEYLLSMLAGYHRQKQKAV